jgi:hypothetical protein
VGTVPGNAQGPVLDLSEGLAVDEIGDRVFLITDGDYQEPAVPRSVRTRRP